MLSRLIYFIFVLAFAILMVVEGSSCKTRKEYIEKNGLHSDKKPSELAKEDGASRKKQKRAWIREQRKAKKAIDKRNRQKLKGNYYN